MRRASIVSVEKGCSSHIVLEESPVLPATSPGKPWQFLALSARTRATLDTMCESMALALEAESTLSLADAAFTLQRGRPESGERVAVVGHDKEGVVEALRARTGDRYFRSVKEVTTRPVAFLFPGVGEQYVNMAADLYARVPAFRDQLDECFALFRRELGDDLRPVLFVAGANVSMTARQFLSGDVPQHPTTQRLNQTANAQPCLFAVEYCLARQLMRWGVQPDAVLGYSVGEFAAAAIAGILTLEDAVRLVAGRARLIDRLPGGAMLAVPLSSAEVKPLLSEGLSIGIDNDPTLTVVSGPTAAMEDFEKTLSGRNVVSRRLATTHAFHSPMMDPAAPALRELLKCVRLQPPVLRCLSNVTGTWITDEEAVDPEYWIRHMCQTARFSDCLATLLDGSEWAMVEVGPGRSLGSLITQRTVALRRAASADRTTMVKRDQGPLIVPTMRAAYVDEDDQYILTATVARLWVSGAEVDWDAYYDGERRRRVPLPVSSEASPAPAFESSQQAASRR